MKKIGFHDSAHYGNTSVYASLFSAAAAGPKARHRVPAVAAARQPRRPRSATPERHPHIDEALEHDARAPSSELEISGARFPGPSQEVN